MDTPFTGTCQCGEVRYVVKNEPIVTVACHCRDCQKLSASAFSLTMLIAEASFELTSGKLKVFERPAEHGGSALCYLPAETAYTMKTRSSLGTIGLSQVGLTIRPRYRLKLTSGRPGHSLGLNFPMAHPSMKRSQT